MCKDGGGVWTFLVRLPDASSAVHEVSRDLLFTAKLIRLGGKPIKVVWRWGLCRCPGHRPGRRAGPYPQTLVPEVSAPQSKLVFFDLQTLKTRLSEHVRS